MTARGWMFQRFVGRYGHDEWLLVLRPTPAFAAVMLAAEVGVVNLHETRELARLFTIGHHLHDLVLELPGGVVAHPKMPLEFQRGQIRLAARQQMHGQEPCCQRQLAALKHRPAGERRLITAGAALVVHPARAAEPRTRPTIALGATKSLRPPGLIQHPVALGFGAVLLDELRDRQTTLKLHLIHRHDVSPSRNMAPRLRRSCLTSRDGWLSVVANQVPLK